MTIEEKLEKIKKLADAMYYAAANLGPTIGSGEHLRKTMEDYHKFIIHEYHKEEPTISDIVDEHYWKMLEEEPVSEDLGDYINELSKQFPEVSFAKLSRISVRVAKWKEQQLMAKAVDIEVKEDAGGYPYIDATIELYDYDKDEPLAKKGDKVKLIIVSNTK